MTLRKLAFTFLGICSVALIFGQSSRNLKLIELGKAYKNFMSRNEPPKQILEDIYQDLPTNLTITANFIVQTITTNNKILSKSVLTLPDTQTLKNIYLVRAINYNLMEENGIDNNRLIDSLDNKHIQHYEMVDVYYDLLFASVTNKMSEFDLSNMDFNLKEYNLSDDTEKGILFLNCMEFCGKKIFGYMNFIKPPNTKKSLELIKKYPKFNGQPYFQYNDFNFQDFNLLLFKNRGVESFKGYYIDKYYEVLLSHLLCLNKEKSSEKDKSDLLLGSILKDSQFYKYTKYKDVLENIFKKRKEDVKQVQINDPIEYIKKETIGGELDFNIVLEKEKQSLILYEGIAYNKKDFAIFLWGKKVKIIGINSSKKATKLWEEINKRSLTEPEKKALIRGFDSKSQ